MNQKKQDPEELVLRANDDEVIEDMFDNITCKVIYTDNYFSTHT